MRIALPALALALPLAVAAAPPAFREHTIVTGLKTGYQLLAADLNHDGKPDLVAVDERGTELAWFENPGWQRHVLLGGLERTINLDFWQSPDGPIIAMADRFESNVDKSVGIVRILTPGADIRQPWNAREIDRVPTAHRIRFIDPRGDGRKLLLVSPLLANHTETTPVYFYRPGEWKRETMINDLTGTVHSIVPVDWPGKRGQRLLSASFDGLRLYEYRGNDRWTFTGISKGDPRACPLCGSSEVRLGKVGKHRMLAAIEPWHGNLVVVYVQRGKEWERTVVEDGMVNGHALAAGDVDGDGRDEIVAGFRGKGFQLYLFHTEDAEGRRWKREVIDAGGLAGADCKIADFTADGRPDIACSGASTGNIKLYENLGTR